MVLMCIFLMISDVKHLFMYLLIICYLWRNIYLDPPVILKLVIIIIIDLYEFINYSRHRFLVTYMICKLFSPRVGVVFFPPLLWYLLVQKKKNLNFNGTQFIYFSSVSYAFRVTSKKLMPT